MLTVYVFCAVIGGGLIVLSLFGGDHEHGGDVSHDTHIGHDGDVSHDADAGHESSLGHHDGPWIPFFSLRFWTYLSGIFGLSGVLLTVMTDSKEPTTAALSGGAGLVGGLIAASLVRWLQTHEADSTARERDFLGVRAKVTVGIRNQQLGRVRATVKGEIIEVLARSENQLALPEGAEVVIVGMEGGHATVMPLDTLLEENS